MFPDAKRVLLTAYADTEAAIRAINAVKLDYYLMKPWDPPEEQLYPVLDDLLDDWRAGYRPPYRGHPGARAPLVAGLARGARLPGPQPDPLPVARRRVRPEARRAARAERSGEAPLCRW